MYPKTIDQWEVGFGRKMTFTVQQISQTHRRVLATSKRSGFVFACSWAGEDGDPNIDRESVWAAWKEKAFDKFDTVTGCYVG